MKRLTVLVAYVSPHIHGSIKMEKKQYICMAGTYVLPQGQCRNLHFLVALERKIYYSVRIRRGNVLGD
jgi:hypothetical protein